MKNLCYILVTLLIASCTGDQISAPKVASNSQSTPGKKQKNEIGARTVCQICTNFSVPSCTCGGYYSGNFNTAGQSYHYPSQTTTICPNATSISVTLSAYDVPDQFTLTYLDKNGGTVTTYISPWMGTLNYYGPWGGPIPRYVQNTQNAPVVNTTAQTTQWPCPFVYPSSSATFTYQNSTGTPVNGVAWSILSNNPAASASLVGNGGLSEVVNFSSSFSSLQLQATTNDPNTGNFQNCQDIITVSIPALSNIVAVKIDVFTVTPTIQSGITPNTDNWSVSVSCTQNTSAGNCPSCY